ncbi:MAG: EVE domain-containing protein [Xanthomonadales bacterium]|nr:EVE domain-containing protein [Xanthomonadales bacterium]NIN59476.1 EVE domain-containing protein [Xanthomonadales bacterium]NIN74850.1 EVE domain-containing protein [Xanthomonadales bacterium]NIO14936.1 EVE domain-containing protein [Xanthomonadales bacterium]NIP11869.1 EVE domain-containing protein [Xanthomonadales bacterium]
MRCWLMKSEPDVFSIDDLRQCPGRKDHWDGVRNYQARNFMRDDMRPGDPVFFYHSNTEVPGIVGVAEVASKPYPDHTAFDPHSRYYDPKSDPNNPRWVMVDIRYRRKLKRVISLAELKAHAEELEGFALIRRGNRLSVMPVSEQHWNYILGLEKA